MNKNNIKSITQSALLAGTMLLTFGATNTSTPVNAFNNQNYTYTQKASKTNESEMLSIFSLPKDKFKVEYVAEELFGEMRSLTIEEQKEIDDYLDSISTPIGVNFWDLC